MESIMPANRLMIFLSHPFFSERTGLAESLISLEMNTGLKIPYDFKVGYHQYTFGEVEFEIGKIHSQYFYFGLKMGEGWFFMTYRNENELKLFINNLALVEAEDGTKIDREHIIFLLQEVDNFPKKI